MLEDVPEIALVKEMLSGNQTLYDMENDLVNRIAKDSFWIKSIEKFGESKGYLNSILHLLSHNVWYHV